MNLAAIALFVAAQVNSPVPEGTWTYVSPIPAGHLAVDAESIEERGTERTFRMMVVSPSRANPSLSSAYMVVRYTLDCATSVYRDADVEALVPPRREDRFVIPTLNAQHVFDVPPEAAAEMTSFVCRSDNRDSRL